MRPAAAAGRNISIRRQAQFHPGPFHELDYLAGRRHVGEYHWMRFRPDVGPAAAPCAVVRERHGLVPEPLTGLSRFRRDHHALVGACMEGRAASVGQDPAPDTS